MKLLLVEDDLRLLRALERDLEEAGYHVDIAWDGPSGLELAKSKTYDLILLDGMLPGIDGWEFLTRLRNRFATPVLMLTARDAVDDRVSGLKAGADDYLTKPFHFDELVARIQALIRRSGGNAGTILKRQNIELNCESRTVTLDGVPVDLTGREYFLLYRLMARKGGIHSNESLLDYLNSDDEVVVSNTIEVLIHRLRKKLGKDRIKTIRGLGYTIPD